MTEQELQEYVGRHVELKLKSGVTFTGRLVAGDDAIAAGAPYVMKSQHQSAVSGVSEPTYTAIPGADAIALVRILEAPVSEDRLED